MSLRRSSLVFRGAVADAPCARLQPWVRRALKKKAACATKAAAMSRVPKALGKTGAACGMDPTRQAFVSCATALKVEQTETQWRSMRPPFPSAWRPHMEIEAWDSAESGLRGRCKKTKEKRSRHQRERASLAADVNENCCDVQPSETDPIFLAPAPTNFWRKMPDLAP